MKYEVEIRNLRDYPFNKVMESNEFRVDRKSIVGNPYYMANESMRDEVCDKYETYFYEQINTNTEFRKYIDEIVTALRQYNKVYLYCWCYPKRCHAETIRKWILNNVGDEIAIDDNPDYEKAFNEFYGTDYNDDDDSDSELDLLARADEAEAYNENYERYMSVMRQDFPKDFADDNPFTEALLDWCEGGGK